MHTLVDPAAPVESSEEESGSVEINDKSYAAAPERPSVPKIAFAAGPNDEENQTEAMRSSQSGRGKSPPRQQKESLSLSNGEDDDAIDL